MKNYIYLLLLCIAASCIKTAKQEHEDKVRSINRLFVLLKKEKYDEVYENLNEGMKSLHDSNSVSGYFAMNKESYGKIDSIRIIEIISEARPIVEDSVRLSNDRRIESELIGCMDISTAEAFYGEKNAFGSRLELFCEKGILLVTCLFVRETSSAEWRLFCFESWLELDKIPEKYHHNIILN